MSAPPTYAAAFRCIGPECEDHCCGDWNIPVDQATYARYQTFPAERLGSTVSEFVFRNAPDAPPATFATIYRAPSGNCPFFGADRLCQIQQTYGPGMLSATCSIYPRTLNIVAGQLEGSLSLSCPEAARQVLLDPDFLDVHGNLTGGAFRTDNTFYPAHREQQLVEVRRVLFGIVRDRSQTVRERLLRAGQLVHHLDRTADLTKALDSFSKDQPPVLPQSPGLRLELVLALSNDCLRDPEISPRFRDTFWSFIEGVGSSGQALPGEDLNRFVSARTDLYQPFMYAAPHLLENYLINYMLQHLFPFGRSGSSQFETRSCSAEWILLSLQFAWLETLLIGIAAGRVRFFGYVDIIRAVQAFTRATEHDPTVFENALGEITSRGLNTLEGMALIL